MVINDIINEFRNGSTTFGLETMQDYQLQEAISCDPFTERFDNDVSGWSADLEITVINHYNACNNPYS